jgi:hypothetical protein
MKNSSKSGSHAKLTLGDLVVAVSSSSRNSREAAAALADLFDTGRVCLSGPRRRTNRR